MKIRVRYRNNTGEVKHGITRAFSIGLTLLAMSTAALLGALLTMRVAIHASEVTVPNLSGQTLDDAADLTHDAKLNLTVENRFYSTTVPAGRVLSQFPAAGVSVRKGWHMRITESIGPQRIPIPDTLGMDQRDAATAIRRASLDLGTLGHIPAPGPADVVLAQTPPPNAEGVDKPEVSLLLSQPIESAPRTWVMPNLVGLSYTTAKGRMKEMNLPLYAIVPQAAAPVAAATVNADGTTTEAVPAAPAAPSGPIASQSPQAGARVTAADNPHVTMARAAYVAPALTTAPAASTPAATPPAAAPIVRVPPAKP
jgi:beta-lactam-binding protein with PASTA domain